MICTRLLHGVGRESGYCSKRLKNLWRGAALTFTVFRCILFTAHYQERDIYSTNFRLYIYAYGL